MGEVGTANFSVISPATMECLREIGLERECLKAGYPERDLAHWYRFSKTMVAGEISRRHCFGNNPHRQASHPPRHVKEATSILTRMDCQGDFFEGSPCVSFTFL